MKKYFILVILLGLFKQVPAFAQTDSGEPDRKAIIKLCRGHLKNAVAFMDSGSYDVASAYLDSVFQCDAGNPDAFYYKARILGWNNDTTGVIDLLSDGVVKAARSSRLKTLLARYLIDKGALDEAVVQIENVLAIKPREGEAIYLKGRILLARNDTTGAIEIYEKALGIALDKAK